MGDVDNIKQHHYISPKKKKKKREKQTSLGCYMN